MLMAITMMALLTQFSAHVHIVYPDEHLKKRDLADFELLFQVSGYDKKVSFHAGLDFEFDGESLLLFDEADTFMLDKYE
jgi:hypothetical protein